jgi:hypothetical protein
MYAMQAENIGYQRTVTVIVGVSKLTVSLYEQ